MSIPQRCRPVDGISVCVTWGLRATDRMISVIAGPDDTGSITPTPDTTEQPARQIDWRAPPRSPEQRIATPKCVHGGRITLRFNIQQGSRAMPAPPRAPRSSRTPPTHLSPCRLHSPVTRHPAALAHSPVPRWGLGSPPACTGRQAEPTVAGCARQRRWLRWARLNRESVHPRLGMSGLVALPTRETTKKDD